MVSVWDSQPYICIKYNSSLSLSQEGHRISWSQILLQAMVSLLWFKAGLTGFISVVLFKENLVDSYTHFEGCALSYNLVI